MKLLVHDYYKDTVEIEVDDLTKEHFSKAANLLDRYGKINGCYYEKGCGMCAIGALAISAGVKKNEDRFNTLFGVTEYATYLDRDPLFREFVKTINISGTDRFPTGLVFHWSDNSSKEEVVEAFRKFANAE